jgi:hypothetical protein
MCPQLSTSFKCSLRASFLAIALAAAQNASAVQYDFLTVSGNNVPGNGASSTFTSSNGNGTIAVTHSFSSGGFGTLDNVNSAINPSQFTSIFPGTGLVQGHLAMTMYNSTSVVEFDLTNYNLSGSTVFGMWNTTDEVAPKPNPGGANTPVYQLQLIDSNNNQVNPTTFQVVGFGDNQTQVAGRHELDLNTSTGEISPGTLVNNSGVHTRAKFWDSIPAGTKKIIVYGDLAPLNTIGDGVGYYFAEVVPEPASLSMLALGGVFLRRRR